MSTIDYQAACESSGHCTVQHVNTNLIRDLLANNLIRDAVTTDDLNAEWAAACNDGKCTVRRVKNDLIRELVRDNLMRDIITDALL